MYISNKSNFYFDFVIQSFLYICVSVTFFAEVLGYDSAGTYILSTASLIIVQFISQVLGIFYCRKDKLVFRLRILFLLAYFYLIALLVFINSTVSALLLLISMNFYWAGKLGNIWQFVLFGCYLFVTGLSTFENDKLEKINTVKTLKRKTFLGYIKPYGLPIALLLLILSFLILSQTPSLITKFDTEINVAQYSEPEKSFVRDTLSFDSMYSEYGYEARKHLTNLEVIGQNPDSCVHKNEYGNYEFYDYHNIYKAKIRYYTWFGFPTREREVTSYVCTTN